MPEMHDAPEDYAMNDMHDMGDIHDMSSQSIGPEFNIMTSAVNVS
mgnify:CR=1 FL=1